LFDALVFEIVNVRVLVGDCRRNRVRGLWNLSAMTQSPNACGLAVPVNSVHALKCRAVEHGKAGSQNSLSRRTRLRHTGVYAALDLTINPSQVEFIKKDGRLLTRSFASSPIVVNVESCSTVQEKAKAVRQ
jgi:hypothetical protein